MSKKKKKKYSPNATGIPVASSVHFFAIDQVIEWTSNELDYEKIQKREYKKQKEKAKLEEKGKMVIQID